MPLRLSVLHHLETASPDYPSGRVYAEVEEQVRLADALGFDTAWVAEHHFSAIRGARPSPLLMLVHLAAHTSRIRLGTAVLPVPFYQPLRLAEDVAMADALMGGRLACGLSSSAAGDEMKIFGASQEGKHERLRQSLDWLRAALTGEPAGPAPGEAADRQAVVVVPAVVQPLDQMLWVAASSHGAAQVAGEFGYHLLLPSLRPLDASLQHVETYRRALADAGRDRSDRSVQLTMHLVVERDHHAALRTAEPIVRAYYAGYVRSGIVERLVDESLDAVMRRINFVAGGPEAVAGRISEIVGALGLTHVAFQSRLNGLSVAQVMHGLEVVAERVAPLLGASMPAEENRPVCTSNPG